MIITRYSLCILFLISTLGVDINNNTVHIESYNCSLTDSDEGVNNLLSDKSIIKADNVIRSKEGTVYVINKKIDLHGKSLTFPPNCTLRFKGGCLVNGQIIGNNTSIVAPRREIFRNVIISGIWNVPVIYVEWMHIPKTKGYDCKKEVYSIMNLQNSSVYNTIYAPNKPLWYRPRRSDSSDDRHLFDLKSNTHLILPNTIYVLPNSEGYYVVRVYEGRNQKAKNVLIDGGGSIIGDIEKHDYINGANKDATGVMIMMADDVEVRNITSSYHPGDGFYIGSHEFASELYDFSHGCENILIDSCTSEYNMRQGMSICTSMKHLTISNSVFSYTGEIKKSSPGSGIDFEVDNEKDVIKDIFLKNCSFIGNIKGVAALEFSQKHLENFRCDNCFFETGVIENGIKVYYGKVLEPHSDSQTIHFINCKMNGRIGRVRHYADDYYTTITFENCDIKGIDGYTPEGYGSIIPEGSYSFKNCNFIIDKEKIVDDYPFFYLNHSVMDLYFNGCTIENTQRCVSHLFECYSNAYLNKIEAINCSIDLGTEISCFNKLVGCTVRFGNMKYLFRQYRPNDKSIVTTKRNGLLYQNNQIELVYNEVPANYLKFESVPSDGKNNESIILENNVITCSKEPTSEYFDLNNPNNKNVEFVFKGNDLPDNSQFDKILNGLKRQQKKVGFVLFFDK